VVELLDFGKADVDLRPGFLLPFGQQLGQAVPRLQTLPR